MRINGTQSQQALSTVHVVNGQGAAGLPTCTYAVRTLGWADGRALSAGEIGFLCMKGGVDQGRTTQPDSCRSITPIDHDLRETHSCS